MQDTRRAGPLRYHQAILVSCQIPWDEHEILEEKVFRKELQEVLKLGFNNVYVFGTAGEGYGVSTAQFQQIVRIFFEETRGEGIFPQVGVIGLSSASIVERLHFAHQVGFRTFQISLPSWGTLNDTEVMNFFTGVCGSFLDSRFLHYNLPRVGRILTAEDYRRILNVAPNLVATKNTTVKISEAADLMRTVPELQHFFSESLYSYGCLYGECSLLSSFGVMLPSRTKQLFEYGRARQFDKLFPMLRQYLDVVNHVLSPTRGTALMDGAYDKMLLRLGGINIPLRLLSPYESLSEETFQNCRRILTEHYETWLG